MGLWVIFGMVEIMLGVLCVTLSSEIDLAAVNGRDYRTFLLIVWTTVESESEIASELARERLKEGEKTECWGQGGGAKRATERQSESTCK